MVKRRKPRGCGFTAAINDETDRAHLDIQGASSAARQDRVTARRDGHLQVSALRDRPDRPEGALQCSQGAVLSV